VKKLFLIIFIALASITQAQIINSNTQLSGPLQSTNSMLPGVASDNANGITVSGGITTGGASNLSSTTIAGTTLNTVPLTVKSSSARVYANPTVVQVVDHGTTGSSTFTSNITAGNVLVVACAAPAPNWTVTDSLNNTFSSATTISSTLNGGIFYATITTGGSDTIYCNGSSSNYISAIELSGVTATSYDSVGVLKALTSSNSTTNSVTTAAPNDIVIAMLLPTGSNPSSNLTNPVPTVKLGTNNMTVVNSISTFDGAIATHVASSTGTYSATWTVNSSLTHSIGLIALRAKTSGTQNVDYLDVMDNSSTTLLSVNHVGKLITSTSTSSTAGFNLPHGTSPSAPANGDCWTTTNGLYCYINGATVGPYASIGSIVSPATIYSTPYYSSISSLSGTLLTGIPYYSGTAAPTVATGAQIAAAIGSTAVTNATNSDNTLINVLASGSVSVLAGPVMFAAGATTGLSDSMLSGDTYLTYDPTSHILTSDKITASSSLQLSSGSALTGNRGTGSLLLHSTGSYVSGDGVAFDSNGNAVDSGLQLTGASTTINGTACALDGSCNVIPASAGIWSSSTAYTANQSVYYSTTGYTYTCISACAAAVLPTNTTYWTQISPVNLAQIGGTTMAQNAAIRANLPLSKNLFNYATVTSGYWLDSGGTLTANSAYVISDYIPCNTSGTMTTSNALSNGVIGLAYYDQTQTFISWSSTAIAAGGSFTCPSTAAWVRVSILATNVPGEMIVAGSTLPSSYVSYGAQDASSQANAAINLIRTYAPVSTFNLFNQSAVSTSSLLTLATGATQTLAGWYVSDYIPVQSGATITVAKAGGGAPSFGGIDFYDYNKGFISQAATLAYAAGTSVTVRANAAYVRISSANSTLTTQMVVYGSSAPSSYVAYGSAAYTQTQAWNALIGAVYGSLSPNFNFFNSSTVTSGYLLLTATGATTAVSGYYTSAYIPVYAGEAVWWTGYAYGTSATYAAIAWYDIAQNFISATAIPAASGAFTAPTGAAYARVSGLLTKLSTDSLTQRTAAPSYNPAFGGAATGGAVSGLSGLNIGIIGDSITQNSTWQSTVVARTGAVIAFEDGRGGRLMGQAFECYGAASAGSTLSTFNTTYTNCGSKLTVGQTVGDSIATDLSTVNMLMIELGTNNRSETIGTLGDTATAGTLYGDLYWVLTTALTANPSLRLAFVTPQYSAQSDSTSLAVATAIEAFGNYWGVPVLNMTKMCGTNSLNASTWLSDGTHPTATSGTEYYGACISAFLNRMF